MTRSLVLSDRTPLGDYGRIKFSKTKWGAKAELPVHFLYRLDLCKLIKKAAPSTPESEDLQVFSRKYPHQLQKPRLATVTLLSFNTFLMDKQAARLHGHKGIRTLLPHEFFCLVDQYPKLDEHLSFDLELVSLHVVHSQEGIFNKGPLCCRARWTNGARTASFVHRNYGWMAGRWFAFEVMQ
jgi:hypothetical protein